MEESVASYKYQMQDFDSVIIKSQSFNNVFDGYWDLFIHVLPETDKNIFIDQWSNLIFEVLYAWMQIWATVW
jgi:hypothetical protein